jgi:predicted enzyme related to lactoylglutathione lyase
MLRRVDEDPNLVWGYQRTARGYVYTPISTAQAKNGSYAMTSVTGGNNQVVFVEKVELSTADQSGRIVGSSGMFYVAVPGGGDLSTGQMDANDYIEVTSGSQTIRLNRQDLDDYSTYASGTGGDFTTPMVDTQSGQLKIGSGFVEQLKDTSPRSTFRMWLDLTAADRGDAWYNSKFVGSGGVGTQGKATDLVSGYADAIQRRIGINIPEQDRAAVIDTAINQYFTETGIVDKTGRIKEAIVASLAPPPATIYSTPETLPSSQPTSGYPATSLQPSTTPAGPPPPSYVSPYILQQTGGQYSVEAAGPRGSDPSAFFFRKAPGSGGVAPIPVIAPAPLPESSPVPGVTPTPLVSPKITPISGNTSGGKNIGRIAL